MNCPTCNRPGALPGALVCPACLAEMTRKEERVQKVLDAPPVTVADIASLEAAVGVHPPMPNEISDFDPDAYRAYLFGMTNLALLRRLETLSETWWQQADSESAAANKRCTLTNRKRAVVREILLARLGE